MKKIFRILLPAFGLCAALLCGCSNEEDVLPTQRDRIVSFLEGSHQPPLVPEEEVEPGSDALYYTTLGNTVYRYIRDVYDPERVNRAEVTRSSTVSITFRLYIFTYATIPDTRLPEYTNDPELASAYVAAGLNVEHWSFEPLRLNLRSADILNGLRLALVGCRQGDRVEAYMTYNMAFGDTNFSFIPRESPICITFTVDSVE